CRKGEPKYLHQCWSCLHSLLLLLHICSWCCLECLIVNQVPLSDTSYFLVLLSCTLCLYKFLQSFWQHLPEQYMFLRESCLESKKVLLSFCCTSSHRVSLFCCSCPTVVVSIFY
ncbi:hypothetical protein VIGAN_04096100, partial [Vigna angularis var. angularis]